MAWDFETDPDFQQKLDWADAFVTEKVEPLDLVWPGLEFTRLEGKRKMSQNRPEADRVGVAQGLAASENALDRGVAPLIQVPV